MSLPATEVRGAFIQSGQTTLWVLFCLLLLLLILMLPDIVIKPKGQVLDSMIARRKLAELVNRHGGLMSAVGQCRTDCD